MNLSIINDFVNWQCLLRQRNFRKFSGKPSEGTLATIYDKKPNNEITNLRSILIEKDPLNSAKMFEFMTKKTHDPEERFLKAVKYFASEYFEDSKVNPLSYYGRSKWKSEQLFEQVSFPYSILRTVLVYGVLQDLSRSNIVLWAKAALEKGEKINVVDDQYRCPTLAEDLACSCLQVIQENAIGVYHASGKDFRICLAPSNSISRRTLVPPSIFSLTNFFGVP